MSKKIKGIKWASVALEGFPISQESFNGFVGLEECTDYGSLDKDSKKPQKAQKVKEKKRKSNQSLVEVPSKKPKLEKPSAKVKLSNGFIVETCLKAKPSLGENGKKKRNKKDKKTKDNAEKSLPSQKTPPKPVKKNKPRLGVNTVHSSLQLSLEEMDAWSSFQIPDEILRALAEQGFKKPTKIQELILPPAMLGRRDILGAAQTGSGKTLAFGIPILAGIMKLKEQADSGIDVYEMPYKKSSAKKKAPETTVENVSKKKFTKKRGDIKKTTKNETSSEGYSSGEDDVKNENADSDKENDDENDESDDEKESVDDEFLEEYDVPIKKKESADEGNESEDSDENNVHLSDMLDSDDMADSSDDENDFVEDQQVNGEESDEDTDSQNECQDDENATEEADVKENDMGCVKVIDDIELPQPVLKKTGKPLYALILTPTRELAMQISQHLISAAKYTGIRIATIVGGLAAVKQERVLSKGPEVVVATPGRLWELLRQGQPHLEQVDTVKFLAIDETDRMLERGHFVELKPLLERLNSRACKRQSFVLSATLTVVHKLPSRLSGSKVTKRGKIINRKVTDLTPENKIKKLISLIGMTDPKVVDITTQNLGAAETLTECRIACSLERKDHYLYYILKTHPGRTIVFCNSIGSVKRLAQLFGILKCSPLPLHASMPQRQRLKNLEKFRDDPHGVLIATDVAARGLDIPDVDHVIHYQVPRTAENYVHRSGRTARANKEGLTIIFMEPTEAANYAKLCRTLNKTTELPTFPVPEQALSSMRDIVTAGRELDKLTLGRRRANQETGWLDKAARDMDMIVDEDFLPRKHTDNTAAKVLQQKQKHLEALISRPLFPKGFSYKFPTLNDPLALTPQSEENALTVMKNAIKSGSLKREKRKSKNAPLLKLQKDLKTKK